uniref:tRNA-guanine(15) transglycosylase n=1 Tax=uncultured marine crenarchaeote E37-7F TaxID=907717 RepID=G9BAN8_9ARCH|nr:7-cyano-7-deazaguanine tRNA-ribosyltransferase [uncultured marine crenarchaeote E37-7F]
MSFEILDRDLLGRIGKFKTKQGVIETPLFLPVVNPLKQVLSPQEMARDFKCQAIITNAYLLKKNFEEEVKAKGIHDFLTFNRTVMTDSGAYQLLTYGQVNISPEEIVQFEEEINTDIAVILDIPTGWNAKWERAEYTVKETLRRAQLTFNLLTRKDILWVGPIQGGNHLDLVAYSAVEIGKMPFHIYALGSPTQVMERYLFNFLVDMIMTAKRNLPVEKPLHLFGAGHPFMLSFAVALGCDIFDSAAYAIFAREGKYLTDYGTLKLKDLEYFSCTCNVCSRFTPKELQTMDPKERICLLTWHNLGTCFTEIKRIKQAIREGRLWELLELRARSHPHLFSAFMKLKSYQEYIEGFTPISKKKGFLYFDSMGLARPEIFRYRKKLREWSPPTKSEILVLLPRPNAKPFHSSREFKKIKELIIKVIGDKILQIDFCFYSAPFGIIPLELDEVYPLSQFEMSIPIDYGTIEYVIEQVQDYLLRQGRKYQHVLLHPDVIFGNKIIDVCRKTCQVLGIDFQTSTEEGRIWSKKAIEDLIGKIEDLQRVCNSGD